MADEKVTIEIDLDLDKQSIKKTQKEVETGFKQSGEQSGKGFKKAFSKESKGATDSLKKSFLSLRSIAVAAASAIATAFTGRAFIQAANEQEDAVNALNASLKRIGEFSNDTSSDLQNFASELQNVTRFGDEVVISQLAFAQSFGASAEQSKEILRASADLASAFNIDLNSAVRNVSKTLGGYAGELGEVLPELKEFTASQLQAGEGISLIAEKFRGAAQADVLTFGGAVDQLSNAFGDFNESLGFFITTSPAIRGAVVQLTTLFGNLAEKLNEVTGGADQGKRLEILKKDLEEVRDQIKKVDDGFSFLGVGGGELEKSLLIEREQLILSQIAETEEKVRSQRLENAQNEKNDLLLKLQELGIITDEQVRLQEQNKLEILRQAREQNLISQEEFLRREQEIQTKSVNQQTDTAVKGIKERANALNSALRSGVVSGLSRTFQFLGASLAQGELDFKGFVGVVISAFGDLAISIGTTVIASSVAIQALKASLVGTGAAAIVLGAALIAIGGGLKALGGSLGAGSTSADVGAPPATGSSGIGTSPTIDQPVDQFSEEGTQNQQTVNIQVEGLIGGRELVEIINDTIEAENVVINQGTI